MLTRIRIKNMGGIIDATLTRSYLDNTIDGAAKKGRLIQRGEAVLDSGKDVDVWSFTWGNTFGLWFIG